MGYIVGIVSMLFPEDTSIVADGTLLSEGSHKPLSIFLEIFQDPDVLLYIQLETYLKSKDGLELPIETRECHPIYARGPQLESGIGFAWDHWVFEVLHYEFLRYDLTVPGELLTACCNLVAALALDTTPTAPIPGLSRNFTYDLVFFENERTLKMLRNSLGPMPQRIVMETCERVMGHAPSSTRLSRMTAFKDLRHTFENSIVPLVEKCSRIPRECSCAYLEQFGLALFKQDCSRSNLWTCIGRAICRGFWCLFVDVPKNTAITYHSLKLENWVNGALGIGSGFAEPINILESLWKVLLGIERVGPDILGDATRSGILIPSSLRNLRLSKDTRIRFLILEGSLIHEGRYFELLSINESKKYRYGNVIELDREILEPSSHGCHTSLVATLKERVSITPALELRITIRHDGIEENINILEAIKASHYVEETEPCSHDPNSSILATTKNLIATNVISPYANGKTSIVMTRDNAEAQLLSCRNYARILLLKDCCLNCAVDQIHSKAVSDTVKMIIV